MKDIIHEIVEERQRQKIKWGKQDHHPLEWLAILGEEVGEVNRAVLSFHFGGTADTQNYRKELVQVAAVAIAAIESLGRRGE